MRLRDIFSLLFIELKENWQLFKMLTKHDRLDLKLSRQSIIHELKWTISCWFYDFKRFFGRLRQTIGWNIADIYDALCLRVAWRTYNFGLAIEKLGLRIRDNSIWSWYKHATPYTSAFSEQEYLDLIDEEWGEEWDEDAAWAAHDEVIAAVSNNLTRAGLHDDDLDDDQWEYETYVAHVDANFLDSIAAQLTDIADDDTIDDDLAVVDYMYEKNPV